MLERSKRRLITVLVLLGICGCLLFGFLHFDRRFNARPENCLSRTYRVKFSWNGSGPSDVEIVDNDVRGRDIPLQMRATVRDEAVNEIKKVLGPTQLTRAEGAALLKLEGCGEPYLISWTEWQVPVLSDLMGAAESWDLDEIRRLVEGGVNINAREIGSGRTAIIWAALDPRKGAGYQTTRNRVSRGPNVETVQFLLHAGADPNARDNDGETALMHADGISVSALLAAGGDVNTSDNAGLTALMYASERGDTKTIQLELAAHANVNASDRNGWTALMYAARLGWRQAVQVLLSAGADRDKKNTSGLTALGIAKQQAEHSREFSPVVEALSTKQ
jgi:ankyrin repeat protein